MKKFVQIYTGGVSGRNISISQIEKKLDSMEGHKPDGIIVGWSLEKQIYSYLRDYTNKRGMELYLWFQVLSEFKSLGDFREIETLGGRRLRSAVFDGDEEFSFYCPSHPDTLHHLTNIYETYFSDIAFDGVLLDRIRFPSLAVDGNALFACSCPFCMKKLEKRGIERKEIEKIHMQVKEKDSLLCIKEYKNGNYIFDSPELEAYLNARTELITDMVKALAGYFRTKGMKVGLDLFAPFLSLFVGQDYAALSKSVDFIKPMLYRCTYTPAGMEYELEGMAGEMAGRMKQIIGMEDGRLTDFMEKELETARKLSSCKIYAGMEIHTVKELPFVSAQSIRDGVERAERSGCEGRVASWNILEASKENLLAFMEGEGR